MAIQRELREEIQEIWSLFREVARGQEETGNKIKKVAIYQEETNRQIQETGKQIKEMGERVDKVSQNVEEVSKNVGDLTGKWGKFVEGLVAPGAVRIFRERAIEVKQTYTRAESQRDGETMEIDVLVVNDGYVIAISVKSTLKVEDVNEHINDLGGFYKFFPDHADRKLIGAVAGIVIEEEADKYAYRKGLFIITQAGENIKILNDEKFRPKLW